MRRKNSFQLVIKKQESELKNFFKAFIPSESLQFLSHINDKN